MIKVYSAQGRGLGQNHHVWEENWSGRDHHAAVAAAADDHLSRYFRKYFPRDGLILEGGCGLGQYVAFYRQEGYNIVGIDFATSTISRLQEIAPNLPVSLGDVTRLPFPDSSVDCYYSGGVVEHFEEGPQRPLREAWRVLRPGGRLIITVPYANTVRRWRHRKGNARREGELLTRRVGSFGPDADVPAGFQFSEYRLARREFRDALHAAGFRIELLRPIDFLWGEAGQWLMARRGATAVDGASKDVGEAPRPGPARSRSWLTRLKRDILVTENTAQVPFGPLMRLANRFSGHMILAVCQPKGKPDAAGGRSSSGTNGGAS